VQTTNNNKRVLLSILISFIAVVTGIVCVTAMLFLKLRAGGWCVVELMQAVYEVRIVYVISFIIIIIVITVSAPLLLYMQWVDRQKF